SSNEAVQLTVPVKNTGKLDGTEIVQVYIRKVNDIDGPVKTLRGYKRVELAEGETQNVVVDLPPSSFEFYDWKQRQMSVTQGEYEVHYGNSSQLKDLKMIKILIQETNLN
ncbi:MAG: fibronectin type III-like domain-contianing protein, partial [Bacteroidales bacterium]|nr:fibronectin type III-like domain-contianing protein [Bacteroidales bacterium]